LTAAHLRSGSRLSRGAAQFELAAGALAAAARYQVAHRFKLITGRRVRSRDPV